MATEVLIRGRVSEALPQSDVDGGREGEPVRISKYGEQFFTQIGGRKQWLANEGSYYTLSNPTIGTFPQYALTTAFNDTTGAMFAFQNIDTPGNKAKRTFLDKLTLHLGGTAPTATVSMEFAIKTDTINRQPTAGMTAALTPVNVNADDSRGSITRAYAFTGGVAMTVPASSGAARLVSRARIPTSLGIVGDQYVLHFLNDDIVPGIQGLTAARAVAAARIVADADPVVIGPGQWAVVYMWWLTAATTAPSFEYEWSIIER